MYTAGFNRPGCLPDSPESIVDLDTLEEGREYLISELSEWQENILQAIDELSSEGESEQRDIAQEAYDRNATLFAGIESCTLPGTLYVQDFAGNLWAFWLDSVEHNCHLDG